MKKYLFLALGVAALTSCSSDEVTELNQGNEIKFTVVADNDSRAATVYCNNNKMDGFYVYANDGSNAFINADLIESADGTNWTNTTATNRYWPETDALDFYAVVLEDESGLKKADLVDDKCVPFVDDFTPNTDVTKQTDLLYAVTLDQTRNSNNGTVALNFRHALSQIEFQAKNTNQYIDVQISEVVVGNVLSSGDFVMPLASTDDKYGQHNGGSDANATIANQGTWTLADTKANYIATSLAKEEGADVYLGTNSIVPLTCADGDDAEGKSWAQTMLLLPQTATQNGGAWDAATEVAPEGVASAGTYLGVKCKIYNVTEVNGEKVRTVVYGEDDYKWALVPVALTWEQGKKYVYTFTFGTGDGGNQPDGTVVLDDIVLSVTVDDFIAGENQQPEVGMEDEIAD